VFNDLTHKRKGDVDIVTHQDRPQGDSVLKKQSCALINRCTFVTWRVQHHSLYVLLFPSQNHTFVARRIATTNWHFTEVLLVKLFTVWQD